MSVSCVHGDTKRYSTRQATIVTPQGSCQMRVCAVPELPIPLLVARDYPLFTALWRYELGKRVRTGDRRERGQTVACVARKQAVVNPVSTDPESGSEGVPEPTSPGEQPEEEPMLPLLDFEGPSETHALSPLRGQFGIAQRGDSVIMQCKLCLLWIKEVATYKNSASNLRKHVERKHPSKMTVYNNVPSARKIKRTKEPSNTPSASKDI
ncbi:hypothetical protein J4Q44_G00109350 [Coregonus suidteri]|uniref:BED-type domain-containing protein n=1 Tax=Coregonus suidteri TaxID=861788 RepID=A0AAN8M0E9_9TELE